MSENPLSSEKSQSALEIAKALEAKKLKLAKATRDGEVAKHMFETGTLLLFLLWVLVEPISGTTAAATQAVAVAGGSLTLGSFIVKLRSSLMKREAKKPPRKNRVRLSKNKPERKNQPERRSVILTALRASVTLSNEKEEQVWNEYGIHSSPWRLVKAFGIGLPTEILANFALLPLIALLVRQLRGAFEEPKKKRVQKKT